MKVNKRSCFYGLLAILLFLLTVRYAFQIEIPRIVLTGILVVMAAIGNLDELIAVAMCCIPMHEAVDFYIVLIACAGLLVLKNFNQIKVGFPLVLVLVMILWEIAHCFIFKWSLNTMITGLVPFLFIGVCLSTDLRSIDYAFIVRLMSVVAIFMGLMQLMILIVNADGNMTELLVTMGRLGSLAEEDTLVGGMINSNSLGIISSLCMTGILQIRSIGARRKSDLVLLFMLLVVGLLTQSRTFLVCLLVMFIMLLFHLRSNWKKMLRILGGTLLIGLLIVLVMNWAFPQTLTGFVERFQVEDITTGRDDIMVQYHKYISENIDVMFFGVGLSDFGEKVVEVYKVSIHVPHNSIQEILVAWGIPGLLLIITMIVAIVVESYKCIAKKTLLNWIPLIIIVIKCMAGQMLTSNYTLLALVLCYLSLCQDISGTKKNSIEL